MTTANTLQGFQFRVTGVTGNSFDARTMQNVKKRVENILYLQVLPDDSVRLEYVGSGEPTPDNNLFIGDRSDALYANSRTGTIEEFIGTVQVNGQVPANNKNFIVTQEFNMAESGDIPLYFKDVLPLDIIPESVRVYDQDFNPVSIEKYKLVIQQEYDETTGLPEAPAQYTEYYLYNNLESFFDITTGEYAVYFLQYTEIEAGQEITKTRILSNEVAYTEAASEDLWYITGDVKPWADAYLWDPIDLIIKLPRFGTGYAIRYEETKRMSVKKPIGLTNTSPWFPRIVNGSFDTGYDSYGLKYRIPEFQNQAFNPVEPYKIAVRVESTKIDDSLIKLPHEEVQSGALYSSFSLTAELDGIVQYAVTDDPLKDGTEYRDADNERVTNENGDIVLWSVDSLLGLDRFSGIVHVSFEVKDAYDLYAVYSYKEIYYELSSLNMNPLFDTDAASELRAIYIVPESAPNNNNTQTESVKWVKISPSGIINSTNQDNLGGNDDLSTDVVLASSSGYALSGIIGLHYNWDASAETLLEQEVISEGSLSLESTETFPRNGWIRFLDRDSDIYRYARYLDKTDTTLILSGDSDEVPTELGGIFIAAGQTIELVNFLQERTTLTNRTAYEELQHVPSGVIPVSHSRYFVLAELSINPPHSRDGLARIDVREDGGGIVDGKYDEAKALQPEIQWLNDFNDFRGQPYPGNAVVVVKLPARILETFTEEQVKKIVGENVAFGVQPLIRYYGYEPNIISVLPKVEGRL